MVSIRLADYGRLVHDDCFFRFHHQGGGPGFSQRPNGGRTDDRQVQPEVLLRLRPLADGGLDVAAGVRSPQGPATNTWRMGFPRCSFTSCQTCPT